MLSTFPPQKNVNNKMLLIFQGLHVLIKLLDYDINKNMSN